MCKKVLLTGADGDIGRDIFKALDDSGYSVVLWVRNIKDDFKKYLENFLDFDEKHTLVCADLESTDSIKNAVKETKLWSKNIDIIINCAGYAYGAYSLMTPLSDLNKVFTINFFAPMQIIQEFARGMIKKSFGRIINIASIQGVIAEKGNLAYGTSKASLIHSTKILAQELGVYGIKVNSISPTAVDSKMSNQMDNESLERLRKFSARGSEISIKEVTGCVMFLISKNSDAINGANLRLDGGMPF